jgi:hypothetical protein
VPQQLDAMQSVIYRMSQDLGPLIQHQILEAIRSQKCLIRNVYKVSFSENVGDAPSVNVFEYITMKNLEVREAA